jgi:hypothetical protein
LSLPEPISWSISMANDDARDLDRVWQHRKVAL